MKLLVALAMITSLAAAPAFASAGKNGGGNRMSDRSVGNGVAAGGDAADTGGRAAGGNGSDRGG